MVKKKSKKLLCFLLLFTTYFVIKLITWKVPELNPLSADYVDHNTKALSKIIEANPVFSSDATINNVKMKPEITPKSNTNETVSKSKAAKKQKPIMSSSMISNSLTNHSTTLKDVTITIKSSIKFHKNRIALILRTWVKRALNQVTCFVAILSDISKHYVMETPCVHNGTQGAMGHR